MPPYRLRNKRQHSPPCTLCDVKGNWYTAETSNNFIEKLQRNAKEILEIFGAFSKICPGSFKALSGTENTAKIFRNNILLVSPLTIHSMKIMFASLLAFLRCVYIKNTISINIDTEKFSIFPSLTVCFFLVFHLFHTADHCL